MFRLASRTLKHSAPTARRQLFSQASGRRAQAAFSQHSAWLACAAAVTGGTVWYATREPIHNDASASVPGDGNTGPPVAGVSPLDGSLATLVWGSNRCVVAWSFAISYKP